jgi:RimJ/RimL family protein N-acetyltransferase
MIDVRNYSVEETLKNGTAVRIRGVRADDKKRISEAFRNLENESIYKRFFQYKKGLSDEELKAATEVDFENEIALMVTIGEKETETIIGAARYVAFDAAGGQRSAEVAFVVEEDYQGLGIASLTLRHLAEIAKNKGIAQFHAEVLQENRGMLAVFKRSGFPMEQESAEGVVHVTMPLRGERPDERAWHGENPSSP